MKVQTTIEDNCSFYKEGDIVIVTMSDGRQIEGKLDNIWVDCFDIDTSKKYNGSKEFIQFSKVVSIEMSPFAKEGTK